MTPLEWCYLLIGVGIGTKLVPKGWGGGGGFHHMTIPTAELGCPKVGEVGQQVILPTSVSTDFSTHAKRRLWSMRFRCSV